MPRGNNRYYLFTNDQDKDYYLSALRQLKEKNKIDIFHQCLMDNHVHLVIWLRIGHTLSKSEEKRGEQYVAFVVDSNIINSHSLQAQLFIGSEHFIRKLEEYYKTRNKFLTK